MVRPCLAVCCRLEARRPALVGMPSSRIQNTHVTHFQHVTSCIFLKHEATSVRHYVCLKAQISRIRGLTWIGTRGKGNSSADAEKEDSLAHLPITFTHSDR